MCVLLCNHDNKKMGWGEVYFKFYLALQAFLLFMEYRVQLLLQLLELLAYIYIIDIPWKAGYIMNVLGIGMYIFYYVTEWNISIIQ